MRRSFPIRTSPLFRVGLCLLFLAPAGEVWCGDKKSADERDVALEQRLLTYRQAVGKLGRTNKVPVVLKNLRVLEDAFPESRPVLVEASRHHLARVRGFAVKVLGELGTVEEDLETIARKLSDPAASVRMAAVMAMRHLGADGIPAMRRLLQQEPKKNIRKMAVKNLELWKDLRAVPHLVTALQREAEADVRAFAVQALERLTKEKLGGDVAAWLEYLDRTHEARMLDYARALQQKKASSDTRESAPRKSEEFK